jgi:hypothetical protein
MMQLPFCKICGEHHSLGHCPLYDEPPEITYAKPVRREDKKTASSVEEEGAAATPKDLRLASCDAAWHQAWLEARQLSPEDMKQETMPDIKPRFDRNAYQRELMRKRAGSKRDERQL